eukprot:scaffold910_cov30-Tisochrysis_lutea.AAC.5
MDNKCVYFGRTQLSDAPSSPPSAGSDFAAATGQAQEEEEHTCENTMEDTAVPLCALGADEEDNPFASASAHVGGAFGGNAIGGNGIEPSGSTRANRVDSTITPAEMQAEMSFTEKENDCSNEELPTFWLDM